MPGDAAPARGSARGASPHVLMTVDAIDDVWTYAVELARALTDRGARVSLALAGPSPPIAQRMAAVVLPRTHLYERTGTLEWMDGASSRAEDPGEWLLALERELRPDVIHLNGFADGTLAWRAPVVVVGHCCALSWWRDVMGVDPPPVCAQQVARVKESLCAATIVVAPTAFRLASLESDYMPLPRARVIFDARYPPCPSSEFSGGKQPVILAAGRPRDPAKNLTTLCQAARDVSWPVCIAGAYRGGDPPLDGVTTLGELPPAELAPWMARAAIYALPARYDAFGLSVFEAALCRCALVLGDVPNLREVWGDAAIYVPPNDAGALSSALRSLIANGRLLEEMSGRSQARASALTPLGMADAYLSAYEDAGRLGLPRVAM